MLTMEGATEEDWATLLFLNCPVGLQVGVDYGVWKVNSQFRGVSLLPFGVHFVYWDAQPLSLGERACLGVEKARVEDGEASVSHSKESARENPSSVSITEVNEKKSSPSASSSSTRNDEVSSLQPSTTTPYKDDVSEEPSSSLLSFSEEALQSSKQLHLEREMEKASSSTFSRHELMVQQQLDMRNGFFVFLSPTERVGVYRWNPSLQIFLPLDRDEAIYFSMGVSNGDFLGKFCNFPRDYLEPWRCISSFITDETVSRIEPVKRFLLRNDDRESSGREEAKAQEKSAKNLGRRGDEEGWRLDEKSVDQVGVDTVGKDAKDDETLESEYYGGEEGSNEVFSGGGFGVGGVGFVKSRDEGERVGGVSGRFLQQQADLQDGKRPPGVRVLRTSKVKHEDDLMRSSSAYLFYTDIFKPSIPFGATPEVVTKLSMDRSSVLERIIRECYFGKEAEILGELQFAFIAFLLGHSYESFEQWKALMILLCNCEDAVLSRSSLYYDFMEAATHQFSQAPDDMFEDDLMQGGNFIKHCISSLCELCSSEGCPQFLLERAEVFSRFIREKFHISPEELLMLDTEDCPVIVEE